MDQQNKTKTEENQNNPAELSDQDLEQVVGGARWDGDYGFDGVGIKSPRDSASGQATGFTAAEPKTLQCELMFD